MGFRQASAVEQDDSCAELTIRFEALLEQRELYLLSTAESGLRNENRASLGITECLTESN
jgi:hypothetical protein